MANVTDLYEAVQRRECVLFLGAGVHYPPPADSSYVYQPEHRPPLGAAFSRWLADECSAELDAESRDDPSDPTAISPGDEQRTRREVEWKIREEQREKKRAYLRQHRDALQRTSWYYEVHHNRALLVNKIKDAVNTGKEPSPLVRALAEMDFPIVITTNYDQLFETALRRAGKEPTTRIYDPRGLQSTRNFVGLPKATERWLFKMHGCVSDPSSIVVTDEDYINFVMRMGDSEDYAPVPQKIRVQFKEWPTLFVGYSLLDYNLRLLFRTLRRRVDPADQPATYSLDPSPDLLVLATYGSRAEKGSVGPLVSFIEQDSWRFVPALYQRVFARQMPP
jgi:hypothetical protein